MISVTDLYTAANASPSRTPVYRIQFEGIDTEFATLPIKANYADEVLADEPSLYLRLGEASGTAAEDSSGSGLDGVYQNTPTLGVTGALTGDSDKAITLAAASSEHVTVADDPLLDPGDVFSIGGWVKLIALGSVQTLFDKGANGYLLHIDASGALVLAKNSVAAIATSTVNLTAGVWTHVMATKNGATVKLYINGVDVTGGVANQTIVATATDLNIGRNSGGTAYVNGSLDEFVLFPTALTAARVRAHYDTGRMLFNRTGVSVIMEAPRGTTSQVIPERGQSSIGSFSFVLQDDGGAITDLIASTELAGLTVTASQGFDSITEANYLALPGGVVDNYKLTPDLTGYEITIREPATLTNEQVFRLSSSPLAVALTLGATELIPVDVSDFEDSGYVRIDQEFIQYSGRVHTGIQIQEKTWDGIAYGNGLFVAVSQDGSIATSPDAKDWTTRAAPEVNQWRAICWSDDLSLFVAVAGTGTHRVMTSPDGIAWTARTAASASIWRAVVWAGGSVNLFVAVGTSAVMSSPDGTTWTTRSEPVGQSHPWTCVAWSPDLGILIALADGDNTGTNRAMSSTDGTSWTTRTISQQSWTCAAWSSPLGIFVGLSNSGTPAVSSTDGTTWTNRSSAEANLWNGVCWSDDLALFVGVSGGGTHRVQTSANGTSWTTQTAAAANQWLAVTAGAGIVVAVSGNGSGTRAMSSADGSTWTNYLSKLTGLTRGVLNSTAASHSVGSAVQEALYITGHPIDIVIGVLENTDKSGLSIDASLVDGAGLAALKTAIGASYAMTFYLTAPVNAKQWLESQIYQVLALYPVTTGGKYSLHQVTVPVTAVDTLTHDNIVANNGSPILTWDRNYRGSVIDSVKVYYDYDIATGKYLNSAGSSDGQFPLVINSQGLRSDLVGTSDLIASVIAVFLARYENGAPSVTMRTFLSKHLLEPGDIVGVTSALLPNPSTGLRGVTDQLMEVISRTHQPESGYVDLQLAWPGWGA